MEYLNSEIEALWLSHQRERTIALLEELPPQHLEEFARLAIGHDEHLGGWLEEARAEAFVLIAEMEADQLAVAARLALGLAAAIKIVYRSGPEEQAPF